MYGIDCEADPSPLDTRTWRWLRVRITALLSDDRSLLRAKLAPPPKQQQRGRRGR